MKKAINNIHHAKTQKQITSPSTQFHPTTRRSKKLFWQRSNLCWQLRQKRSKWWSFFTRFWWNSSIFYSKNKFLVYHAIDNRTVQSASTYSHIIGKGIVMLSFDKNVNIEACNSALFSTNILSFETLNKKYNNRFICKPPVKSSVSTCMIIRRSKNQTVACIEILNRLYYVKPYFQWKHKQLKSYDSINPKKFRFIIVIHSPSTPKHCTASSVI